jgi:hypothetical protein
LTLLRANYQKVKNAEDEYEGQKCPDQIAAAGARCFLKEEKDVHCVVRPKDKKQII